MIAMLFCEEKRMTKYTAKEDIRHRLFLHVWDSQSIIYKNVIFFSCREIASFKSSILTAPSSFYFRQFHHNVKALTIFDQQRYNCGEVDSLSHRSNMFRKRRFMARQNFPII